MVHPSTDEISNRLLCSLSDKDRTLLKDMLQRTKLERGTTLEQAGKRISHAYFIDSGMASIVALGPPDHRIEAGMIGFEGMTGLSLVLGSVSSQNETVVQSSGWGNRIAAGDLVKALQASATLHRSLLRYAHVFSLQVSHTALANGCGLIEQRLARWILMWSDRLRSHDVPATHNYMALLLGIHRPSATHALHILESKRAIRSDRGMVRVIDRAALMQIAGTLYGIPEAEYELMINERRKEPDPGPPLPTIS